MNSVLRGVYCSLDLQTLVSRHERPEPAAAASPLDLTPRPPDGATPAQCVEMWIDLMNVCDELLLARLRREVGPEGDVMAAYREWYRRDREEHDRALIRMLERLDRAVQEHGC